MTWGNVEVREYKAKATKNYVLQPYQSYSHINQMKIEIEKVLIFWYLQLIHCFALLYVSLHEVRLEDISKPWNFIMITKLRLNLDTPLKRMRFDYLRVLPKLNCSMRMTHCQILPKSQRKVKTLMNMGAWHENMWIPHQRGKSQSLA